MVVARWGSGFPWRTIISSWSHTLWWKWPRNNNNLTEFAWGNFRRNNVFIPEYFLKDFYRLKLTTTIATKVSSEGLVFFTLPQDAVTTYWNWTSNLKIVYTQKYVALKWFQQSWMFFLVAQASHVEDQLLLFQISHSLHASNSIQRWKWVNAHAYSIAH